MDIIYAKPDAEPCSFKMSMYGTCPNGHRGCISHHGRVFIDGHIEIVGKTGVGPDAKVFIRRHDEVEAVTPADVRELSGAKEHRAYMRRLQTSEELTV